MFAELAPPHTCAFNLEIVIVTCLSPKEMAATEYLQPMGLRIALSLLDAFG